jgi:hypothetical protein
MLLLDHDQQGNARDPGVGAPDVASNDLSSEVNWL